MMKLWTRIAMVLLFVPLVASAQYRDLDTASATLERGFGSGDAQAIVSGIGATDSVKLQFPGLIEQSGFYGRDQVQYILERLFSRVNPSGFEKVKAVGASSAGQYHITARWTIQVAGKAEVRELYITLKGLDGGRWSVVSLTSAGK